MGLKEIQELGLTGFGYWMLDTVKGSSQAFFVFLLRNSVYAYYSLRWWMYKEAKQTTGGEIQLVIYLKL